MIDINAACRLHTPKTTTRRTRRVRIAKIRSSSITDGRPNVPSRYVSEGYSL